MDDTIPSDYIRHVNPDGEFGGIVSLDANISPTAFIGRDERIPDVLLRLFNGCIDR